MLFYVFFLVYLHPCLADLPTDSVSSGRLSTDVTPCGSPTQDIDSFLLQETLKEVVSDTELGSIAANAKSFDVVSGSQIVGEVYKIDRVGEQTKSGMHPRPSVVSLGITSSIEDYMTLTEPKTDEGECNINF